MSSNYPINNERSPSPRPDIEPSFTQNISTRMKNFFKINKWFTSPTMSNPNELERSPEDIPGSPPNKKMRFNNPGTSAGYTSSVETKNASTNTDSTEIHSPVHVGVVRTPTPTPPTYSEDKEEKSNYNHSFSIANNSNSVMRKRKSICDRSDHSNAYESKFYLGETMYGGSRSYMNCPNIKYTKDMQIYDDDVNHSITISNTARRICDLLDNYSSPLIEAKRISQCTNRSTNINKFVSNISLKKNTVTKNRSFAAKTQELHSPCLANILKFKQKTRLMDATKAARQLIASQSSSEPYILPNNKSSNNREKKSEDVFTTKMKTKLTRPDHGILVKETQPALDLPSNALQIDMNNLPTFSQLLPKPDNEKNREPVNIEWFKFSSPEKKGNDCITIVSPPNWSGIFGNKEILEKTITMLNAANSLILCRGNNKRNDSDAPVPMPIINASNVPVPTPIINASNVPVPTPIINASDASVPIPIINAPDAPVTIPIINASDAAVPLPISKASDVPKPIPITIDLDKWCCPTCMIMNNDLIESCVCCGEKKPKKTKSSNTVSNPNTSNTSTLSTILVDSQKEKWECPECYVLNEKNVNKCVCCEANKPGISGITQNKGFNFSQTNKNTFKFGINPKDYTNLETPSMEITICDEDIDFWEPYEEDTHNKFTFVSDATTVAPVEPIVFLASVAPAVPVVTSAPVATVASTVFAAPISIAAPIATAAPAVTAAPVSTAASLVTTAPVVAAEPKFAAAPVATAAPVVAAAPISAAAPLAATAPIVAPVPEATAAPITAAVPLPFAASAFTTSSLPTAADIRTGIDCSGNQTAILSESSQKPDKSIASGPSNILMSSLSPMQPTMSTTFINNRDTSNNVLQIASTSIQALNTFSFSTAPPQAMPVVTLFSPPKNSSSPFSAHNTQVPPSLDTPASNVSQISFASNPVTTSASFFTNNNLISNPAPSTSSLFKRSETTSIGTSNVVVHSPSIFSFGQNTQAPQPENSKFNFSFAKKIPEAPSIFSAQPFGNQPSNNIESNKTFNLTVPSGNVLSNDTSMMINILPGNGGNPMESISRGNGIVTMGDGTTSNQMLSGNNVLGGNSSHSTAPGFHTQMNRDIWHTSNTGANSFSFMANTRFNSPNSVPTPPRFNSPNSVPTPPRFENPSGPPATRFGLATQMPVNLPSQNMFGSHPPVGGMFGAPSMPSTMAPPAPSFERNFGNPATFNFGVGPPTAGGMFGQPQMQQNQPAVYNFGGQSNGIAPPVQFSMGSSPGTPARRVRKAIRRTTQR